MSLNVINGWANLFSIGHGGIMLVDGYAAALLTLPVAFKSDILDLALPAFILNNQMPFLPALLIGGIAGFMQDVNEASIVNGQSFFRIIEGDVVFNTGWKGCGVLRRES